MRASMIQLVENVLSIRHILTCHEHGYHVVPNSTKGFQPITTDVGMQKLGIYSVSFPPATMQVGDEVVQSCKVRCVIQSAGCKVPWRHESRPLKFMGEAGHVVVAVASCADQGIRNSKRRPLAMHDAHRMLGSSGSLESMTYGA